MVEEGREIRPNPIPTYTPKSLAALMDLRMLVRTATPFLFSLSYTVSLSLSFPSYRNRSRRRRHGAEGVLQQQISHRNRLEEVEKERKEVE